MSSHVSFVLFFSIFIILWCAAYGWGATLVVISVTIVIPLHAILLKKKKTTAEENQNKSTLIVLKKNIIFLTNQKTLIKNHDYLPWLHTV